MKMRLFSTHATIKEIKGFELQEQIEHIVTELSFCFELSSCPCIEAILRDIRKHIPPSLAGWGSKNTTRNLIGTCKLITNIEFEQAILRVKIIAETIKKDQL